MGFSAPEGEAAFNVLIRALEYYGDGRSMRFGAGFRIVRNSLSMSEWRECYSKGAFLTAARTR